MECNKGEGGGAREAIMQLWSANGNQASKGTKMHAELEDYLNEMLVLPSHLNYA